MCLALANQVEILIFRLCFLFDWNSLSF